MEIKEDAPKQKVEEISRDLALIQQKASGLTVNSQQSFENATKLVAVVKARWKRVEEVRTFFVKPLQDLVKKYNGEFKPLQEALEAIEDNVKADMSAYAMQQEKARRAEEARLQAIHDKEMAKEEKKADKLGLDFVPTAAPVVASTTQMVKTNVGKAVSVPVWNFKIVDVAKVPREYCTPNEAMIRGAVKSGVRKIDGVSIFEEMQMRVGK